MSSRDRLRPDTPALQALAHILPVAFTDMELHAVLSSLVNAHDLIHAGNVPVDLQAGSCQLLTGCLNKFLSCASQPVYDGFTAAMEEKGFAFARGSVDVH